MVEQVASIVGTLWARTIFFLEQHTRGCIQHQRLTYGPLLLPHLTLERLSLHVQLPPLRASMLRTFLSGQQLPPRNNRKIILRNILKQLPRRPPKVLLIFVLAP